jgi:hypothetical protein
VQAFAKTIYHPANAKTTVRELATFGRARGARSGVGGPPRPELNHPAAAALALAAPAVLGKEARPSDLVEGGFRVPEILYRT